MVAAVSQAQSGLPLWVVLASHPLVPTKGRLDWLFHYLAERTGRQWGGGGEEREVTGTQRGSFVLWETLGEEAGWSLQSV